MKEFSIGRKFLIFFKAQTQFHFQKKNIFTRIKKPTAALKNVWKSFLSLKNQHFYKVENNNRFLENHLNDDFHKITTQSRIFFLITMWVSPFCTNRYLCLIRIHEKNIINNNALVEYYCIKSWVPYFKSFIADENDLK